MPCKTNPLGVKGAGEAGAIGSCPAVMNAIVDALWRAYRIRHIDMPATPQRVWQAIAAGPESPGFLGPCGDHDFVINGRNRLALGRRNKRFSPGVGRVQDQTPREHSNENFSPFCGRDDRSRRLRRDRRFRAIGPDQRAHASDEGERQAHQSARADGEGQEALRRQGGAGRLRAMARDRREAARACSRPIPRAARTPARRPRSGRTRRTSTPRRPPSRRRWPTTAPRRQARSTA